MTLPPGTRLGPYEVVAQLGAGGMGEVYRARDTRLERSVAIKVLGLHLAADPEFRLRFEREARAVSSLDHPNICALFDVGDEDGTAYLVMPLLDGETLADRLSAQRPDGRGLPVSVALKVAVEVASALEAAHERGIIHRDLKPANIFVMRDGTAKILDFGLAKELALAGGGATDSTTMSPSTEAGVLLGTAAYMSPEQVRGLTVDKRTDIWAFGCVLYQMLAGRPPFAGDTASDLYVAVLEREPDWQRLPEALPAGVTRLLRRCLQKDPRQRLHDIADARIEIQESRTDPSQPIPATAPARSGTNPWPRRLVWVFATAALAAAIAIGAGRFYRQPPATLPETRLDITTPPNFDPVSMAISPDGRSIAFVAAGDGPPRVWVRQLEGTSARELPGTEGAYLPFWSPDGRSLGFFSAAKLKRIDLAGGAPMNLADVSPGVGGSWGADGVILFSRTLASGLTRVSAQGGDVTPVTTLAARQSGHASPHFLPDGRRFLFFAIGAADTQGVYVSSLDGEAPTMLTRADSAGAYASGHVLFAQQTTLMARRFDPSGSALVGDAVTVASPVMLSSSLRTGAAFSATASGLIAYRLEGSSRRQLTWFDRSGKSVGTFGDADDQNLVDPELSPDGHRVLITRTVERNTDIWLNDGGRLTRLTTDPLEDQFPVWSPDGSRFAFTSTRNGSLDLYEMAASGPPPEKLLLASPVRKASTDWSPDGRFLLYHSPLPNKGPDILALALTPADTSFVVLDSVAPEVWGQFSPDGQFIAYQDFDNGRSEIAVREFRGPGRRRLVSTAGGNYPRWAADGRELYYIQSDGKLMAAPVHGQGEKLDIGPAAPLFQPPIVGGGSNIVGRRQQYDVARDGRFLINVTLQEIPPSPITVVLNWQPK